MNVNPRDFSHVKFTTEDITTAEQFVNKVNEVHVELNAAWAIIKPGIPVAQQPAGEVIVRAVLTT